MSVRVSNISAMRALPTTAFSTDVANTVFVETVGDFFRFARGSALTPVSNYVVASSDGLGQWFRMGIPNPTFLAASYWAIDPAGGNDENTGYGATQAAADLVPLKTMAELNRRIIGSNYTSDVTFHQLSSMTTVGETLSNLKATTWAGRPIWTGAVASTSFSGALTTYTAANPAGNAGVQLAMSSLPVSWTASGLVGKMVESADRTRCAWVLKDLGTKTARITTPTSGMAPAFATGSAATFTAAETLNVVTPVDLPLWPFPATGVAYAAVDCVNFTDGPAGTTFDSFDTGTSLSFISRCKFSNSQMLASLSSGGTTVSGSMFVGVGGFFTIPAGTAALGWCGASGTTITASGGNARINISHGTMDFQNAKVLLAGSAMNTFSTVAAMSFFDVASGTAAIVFNDYAAFGRALRMNSTAPVYGSGNSIPIISMSKGGAYTLLPPALWYVTTGAANPILFDGAGHPFSDIPFRDANTGTFANLAP